MTEFQDKHGGEILKAAREAQGIALETVHDMTKIPLDALKAIEENYKVKILSPFYLRGFIKMYAQYLGVDPKEVMNDYPAEEPAAPLPVEKKQEPEEEKDVDIHATVKTFFTEQRQQQIVKGVAVLFALFLVSRLAGCVRGCQRDRADQKEALSNMEVSTAQNAEDVPAATQAPAQQATSAPQAPAVGAQPPKPKPAVPEVPAAVRKKVLLTIKAKKTGWLQVKVDGNLVFQSIFSSGSAETWQADKEIEVSGKVIHNLEYEVNGKLLGGLGRADRTARRVIVNKDGLTVKK